MFGGSPEPKSLAWVVVASRRWCLVKRTATADVRCWFSCLLILRLKSLTWCEYINGIIDIIMQVLGYDTRETYWRDLKFLVHNIRIQLKWHKLSKWNCKKKEETYLSPPPYLTCCRVIFFVFVFVIWLVLCSVIQRIRNLKNGPSFWKFSFVQRCMDVQTLGTFILGLRRRKKVKNESKIHFYVQSKSAIYELNIPFSMCTN